MYDGGASPLRAFSLAGTLGLSKIDRFYMILTEFPSRKATDIAIYRECAGETYGEDLFPVDHSRRWQ